MIDTKNLILNMQDEVLKRIQEKINIINLTKGVKAYIEHESIQIQFEEELADDLLQDKIGVFFQGGAILKKKGEEKLKNGEKITVDDYYIFNPAGSKL